MMACLKLEQDLKSTSKRRLNRAISGTAFLSRQSGKEIPSKRLLITLIICGRAEARNRGRDV